MVGVASSLLTLKSGEQTEFYHNNSSVINVGKILILFIFLALAMWYFRSVKDTQPLYSPHEQHGHKVDNETHHREKLRIIFSAQQTKRSMRE